MSILYENQKPISNDIYNSLEKKELFNIPTGRGKTFILLDVARRCISDGKKVIISVPSNNLVKEMEKTAKKTFGFSDQDTNIVIGNDNYIDFNQLQFLIKTKELENYVTRDSIEEYSKWIKNINTNELFFDDFEKIIVYKDIGFSNIVKTLLKRSKKNALGFSDSLSITNHFFLLRKVIYDKNFELKDYVVLVDEVHKLDSVATTILSESISIFDIKNRLKIIKDEISLMDDFYGKSSLLKNTQSAFVSASKTLLKLQDKNKVGKHEKDLHSVETTVESVKNVLKKDIITVLNNKKELFSQNSKEMITNLKNEKDSINNISANIGKKNTGVYYSPSRGYPTIKHMKKNVLGQLNYKFWKKIKYFAGVSATVTSSFSPDLYETLYGYSRLGMIEKDIKKEYKIHYYDRTFPKENVQIYLPEDTNIKRESVYADDFIGKESVYYNYIVDFVYKNSKNENSIVLCGGYKEAKFLSELFQIKYPNSKVIHANTSEKSTQTIQRFKQNGGILFATREYNTGISLEGDALTRLFILKFPYDDIQSRKWIELKEKGMGLFTVIFNREMLIELMQTLGRLQRTKEDSGKIFLLDQNYNMHKKKGSELGKKIDDILSVYGVVKAYEAVEDKKKKKEIDIDSIFGM